jgi:hypothetical protein
MLCNDYVVCMICCVRTRNDTTMLGNLTLSSLPIVLYCIYRSFSVGKVKDLKERSSGPDEDKSIGREICYWLPGRTC